MDEYSDAKLPQVGGPAISDYVKDIKVPDRFTMELDLKDIVGTLPDDQDTTPDIPQDLRDEYNQKMAEHGISTDDADYESLTEEQKNLEHQFSLRCGMSILNGILRQMKVITDITHGH